MPRFAKSLFGQVVIALVLGVLAGLFAPEFAVKLKPLCDGFIKLIKMIIPVLVLMPMKARMSPARGLLVFSAISDGTKS